ncbi:STAS-like domain-containing protein [Candidatus Uhrbacteria bacterium]|nr:STAS-like domain-containing protein [Candidatus Uhrbacteria bacterium]
MKIELKKFGTMLLSRPAGREAWLAAQAYLLPKDVRENVEVDFSDVAVLSPSWADEFITKLSTQYPARVTLLPSNNPSVKATLRTIGIAQ